jgi:hypothetical protein
MNPDVATTRLPQEGSEAEVASDRLGGAVSLY